MKTLITLLLAICFSQQVVAVTTAAGIDFIDIADTLDNSVGDFTSNSVANGTGSIVDGNSASYIFSYNNPAYVDVSFGGDLFNVSDVDLTILFVTSGAHSGTVSLLGGSGSNRSTGFSIGNLENYTGFDAVSQDGETVYGSIFYTTIDLSGFSGTFGGVRLDISGASAVPSLLGTTSSAPVAAVPVPAAVWLFGSGLLGLIGIARKAGSGPA